MATDTCNNCSRPCEECPNCRNGQFCSYCNWCNICGNARQQAQERQRAKELTCIKCGHVWPVAERVVRRQKLTACPKCTAYNSTLKAKEAA